MGSDCSGQNDRGMRRGQIEPRHAFGEAQQWAGTTRDGTVSDYRLDQFDVVTVNELTADCLQRRLGQLASISGEPDRNIFSRNQCRVVQLPDLEIRSGEYSVHQWVGRRESDEATRGVVDLDVDSRRRRELGDRGTCSEHGGRSVDGTVGSHYSAHSRALREHPERTDTGMHCGTVLFGTSHERSSERNRVNAAVIRRGRCHHRGPP